MIQDPEIRAAFDAAKAAWERHQETAPEELIEHHGYTILARADNVFIYAPTPDWGLLVAGRISVESAKRIVESHRETGRLAA